MAKSQTALQREEGIEGLPPSYFIFENEAEVRHRSLPFLIASRRCYACQQAEDEEAVASSDARDFIERIVEHCGQTPDYLPSDSPLKEAIFRVILAGANEPKTAEEISQALSEKWALAAYPRDVSPPVIQRLLDHSQSYCIGKAPEAAGHAS